jgi:hypothetical protein
MATEFPHAVKVAPHRNVKWVILGIFLRIPAAEAHRHKYGDRKLVAGKFRNLRARRERVTRVLAEVYLGVHPKPAIEGHLKTGHR